MTTQTTPLATRLRRAIKINSALAAWWAGWSAFNAVLILAPWGYILAIFMAGCALSYARRALAARRVLRNPLFYLLAAEDVAGTVPAQDGNGR
jgi:hypothetical protein